MAPSGGESSLGGEVWYRGGLRFACTRCGSCCGGASGTVRVSDAEIAALAREVVLGDAEFRVAFTRRLPRGELSLRERSDGTCVFYDVRRGCTVYASRPRQCRTWPFWRAVVHSPERWAEEAERCPGMGRGPLHDATWIERTARDDGTSGAGTAGAGAVFRSSRCSDSPEPALETGPRVGT